VNEVVNGLVQVEGHASALGVIPLGTANDFARSAGIYINLDGEPTHATHHRFEIDAGRLKLHLPESTPLLTHEGET
jgi:diacylglycerol kinase family enzyme